MNWDKLAALRVALLTIGGLAALVYAAFLVAHALGFAALGVALLLFEYLTSPAPSVAKDRT